MIELLEERIFSIKEFRKMSLTELKELWNELSDRFYWRNTTENYNYKKVYNLVKNESKINKVVKEKILNKKKEK